MSAVKFKQRGDLLAFASTHPGALTGYFLGMLRRRLSSGRITHTRQLREVAVSTWAREHSGLTEVRDQREAQTLAAVMDCVNNREMAQAMDIMTQRITALQKAKAKGGSWDKAGNLELVMGGSEAPAPGGFARLVA